MIRQSLMNICSLAHVGQRKNLVRACTRTCQPLKNDTEILSALPEEAT